MVCMFKPIVLYKNRPSKSGLPSAGIGRPYLLLTEKKEKQRGREGEHTGCSKGGPGVDEI